MAFAASKTKNISFVMIFMQIEPKSPLFSTSSINFALSHVGSACVKIGKLIQNVPSTPTK
jgi:hypothetical protein